jgi:hypothetical protein
MPARKLRVRLSSRARHDGESIRYPIGPGLPVGIPKVRFSLTAPRFAPAAREAGHTLQIEHLRLAAARSHCVVGTVHATEITGAGTPLRICIGITTS